MCSLSPVKLEFSPNVVAAFFGALILNVLYHYESIVQNEWFGYPQEWMPTVSATTGDHYPGRSWYQYAMATAGLPKGILLYLLFFSGNHISLGIELLHTLLAGSWTFVTSSDNLRKHEIGMILFVVSTVGRLAATRRRRLLGLMLTELLGMGLLYYVHKVMMVPGAYSVYAVVEWLFSATAIYSEYIRLVSLSFGKSEMHIRMQLDGSK